MRVQSGSGGRGWGQRGTSSFHQEGPCLLCNEFRLDPVGVMAHSPGKQQCSGGLVRKSRVVLEAGRLEARRAAGRPLHAGVR